MFGRNFTRKRVLTALGVVGIGLVHHVNALRLGQGHILRVLSLGGEAAVSFLRVGLAVGL